MAATGIDGGIDGGNATGGGGGPIVLANPSATTEEAIRDLLISLLVGTVPQVLSGDRFRAHREDGPFLPFCERTPGATFRLFSIRDSGQNIPPLVTNMTEELRTVIFDVLVAYPDNYRYGIDGGRDQDDVMRSDLYLIEGAIGLRGYGNVVNASWLRDYYRPPSIEHGAGVTFWSLGLGYLFTRSEP